MLLARETLFCILKISVIGRLFRLLHSRIERSLMPDVFLANMTKLLNVTKLGFSLLPF